MGKLKSIEKWTEMEFIDDNIYVEYHQPYPLSCYISYYLYVCNKVLFLTFNANLKKKNNQSCCSSFSYVTASIISFFSVYFSNTQAVQRTSQTRPDYS